MMIQKVNVNVPVNGSMLDYPSYDSKFELWHDINSALAEHDPKALEKHRDCLWDFTYWVYSFFRNDKNERFKVTAYQDLIASCAIQHDFTFDNPNRFILYRASNQAGKSALLVLLSVYLALTKTNVNIIMVSNNLRASQFLTSQIKQFLNNSTFAESWKEVLGDTANTTHLTFRRDLKSKHGKVIGESINRILCVPSTEGALGYPVHYMFLDEADFYDDGKRFFWKVAYPRTNKTKGQIILFSNPNPDLSNEGSILHELWYGSLFQRKFHFNFMDAPWNTKADLEMARKNAPSYIFESTHLGEFPTDSGSFFTRTELDAMFNKDWVNSMPVVDRPIYIGLDFAKVKDSTVLSLGTLHENKDNPKIQDLHVRYLKEYELKTSYDVIVQDLKGIVEYYGRQGVQVGGIGFDATGVGSALSDFIKASGIKATDVKFSLQNKSRMYGNFKLLAEQRRIKIVNLDKAKKQMSMLVFKKTANGYLSVHHASESTHDDFPDSLCALIDVSVMPGKVPASAVFVSSSQKNKESVKPYKDIYAKGRENYIKNLLSKNNSMNKQRNPYGL